MIFGGRILNLIPSTSFTKTVKDVIEFRALIRKIVSDKKKLYHERKSNGFPFVKKDMLDILFEHLDSNEEANDLDDEDVVNEFIAFFVAGMDTTGHLTAITTYYLSQNPSVMTKCEEEISSIYKDGSTTSLDEIQQMDYLQSILKESLRLATPSPAIFPRVALQDHMLGNVPIAKGTMLNIAILANMNDENIFHDPTKFLPERWSKDESKIKDSFAYIPFSAGSRNCIGQHLAMIEAKIIIAEFVKTFEFELKKGYKFLMKPRALYEPVDPIKLNLKVKGLVEESKIIIKNVTESEILLA